MRHLHLIAPAALALLLGTGAPCPGIRNLRSQTPADGDGNPSGKKYGFDGASIWTRC